MDVIHSKYVPVVLLALPVLSARRNHPQRTNNKRMNRAKHCTFIGSSSIVDRPGIGLTNSSATRHSDDRIKGPTKVRGTTGEDKACKDHESTD